MLKWLLWSLHHQQHNQISKFNVHSLPFTTRFHFAFRCKKKKTKNEIRYDVTCKTINTHTKRKGMNGKSWYRTRFEYVNREITYVNSFTCVCFFSFALYLLSLLFSLSFVHLFISLWCVSLSLCVYDFFSVFDAWMRKSTSVENPLFPFNFVEMISEWY